MTEITQTRQPRKSQPAARPCFCSRDPAWQRYGIHRSSARTRWTQPYATLSGTKASRPTAQLGPRISACAIISDVVLESIHGCQGASAFAGD